MVNSPAGTRQLSQSRTKKYTAMQLSKADEEYQIKGAAGPFRSEETQLNSSSEDEQAAVFSVWYQW